MKPPAFTKSPCALSAQSSSISRGPVQCPLSGNDVMSNFLRLSILIFMVCFHIFVHLLDNWQWDGTSNKHISNVQGLPIISFLSETLYFCSELTCLSTERILLVLVVMKASKYDSCTVWVVLFVKKPSICGVRSAEQSCYLLPHVYGGVFYDLLIGSILWYTGTVVAELVKWLGYRLETVESWFDSWQGKESCLFMLIRLALGST